MRVHLFISGRVQGVFFRAHTAKKARELGLVGWVRNTDDGRVEAVFEGPKEKVDQMIKWCWRGSSGAKVEKVSTSVIDTLHRLISSTSADRQPRSVRDTSADKEKVEGIDEKGKLEGFEIRY